MGAIFAFAFAVFVGFVGLVIFLPLGIIFRKKKVVPVVCFSLSGICLIPIMFFVVVIVSGILNERNLKKECESRNGKVFAEMVYGDIRSVRKAVSKSENLNVLNEYGESPLYLAATRGARYMGVMREMVERGADPNFANSDGTVPLHVAASYAFSSTEMVVFLLESGADVNKKDEDGNTPLMRCLKNSDYTGKRTLETAQILLKHHCDTTVKNNSGDDAAAILERKMKELESDSENYSKPDWKHSEAYKNYEELYKYISE